MQKFESKLFEKFENSKLNKNSMVIVDGGTNTGSHDCTGDAMSPDCGDNQSTTLPYKDDIPTSLSDDSCNYTPSKRIP